MAKQSKFFRVAVEGATADGRTIERQQLVEMAASYNPATYGARVNMEHIRGVTADKPFRALGDVTALKTEEVELDLDGKKVKKLALFAQITPNEDLLAINAVDQKKYSSIEINPNFAGTGKAYLMGLAVTDSPASLGTEMLQFVAGCREKGVDPFAARRLAPGNLFTAASETAFEFVDVGDAPPTEAQSFFAAALETLKSFTGKKEDAVVPPVPPVVTAPPEPANDNVALAAIAGSIEQMSKGIAAMSTDFANQISAIKSEVAQVKLSIETTEKPGQLQRQPASGGGDSFRADC